MKKIISIFLILSMGLNAQDYDNGKQLFRNNCAACHNMEKKVIGPALKNVVKNQGEDWTKSWIKNNQALRDAGDKHANEIFKEYNGMAMPAYEHLGDEAINDITVYLAQYNDKKAETQANQPAPIAGAPVMVQQVLIIVILVLKSILDNITDAYRKSRATEIYLMKKQKLDFQEVNKEFDDFIEDEVQKRVEMEMKRFGEGINKLTKFTFKKKK